MRAFPVILALLGAVGCGARQAPAARGRLFQAPLPALLTRREAHQSPSTFKVADYLDASPENMEDLVSDAKKLYLEPKGLGRNCDAKRTVPKNVLAGFTTALAIIPQAVAFSLIAGVSPLTGLWTSVVMGVFSSIFGGKPGAVATASGACAMVMAPLVAKYGVWYMPGVVMLAGLLQVAAGMGKLGKFVNQAPKPVMLGVINGLALLMAQSQLKHFQTATGAWMAGPELFVMGGLTTLTFALMQLLPRVTSALPSSFVAVLATTGLAGIFSLPTKTLADLTGAATFGAGGLSLLPALSFPALDWLAPATWAVVTPFAITLAAVGLIESMLAMNLADGMTGYGKRGDVKKETIGQGVSNFAASLAGGMGGSSSIGQSLLSLNAGGNTRLSGIAMSAFLAGAILFGAPLLAQVPVAALVGVLLAVAQKTFSWSSTRLWNRMPKMDFLTLGLVSLVTLTKDVAAGAFVGIAASAITFAYKKRQNPAFVAAEGAMPSMTSPIPTSAIPASPTSATPSPVTGSKYGPYDGPVPHPDPTSSYLENLTWHKA